MIARHLLLFLLISIVINGAMFAIAYVRQTDKLTDISYAVSFIALVVCALIISDVTPIQLLLAAMVGIWACRLGTYLLVRIRKVGHDARFNVMRSHVVAFGRFWLLQAISVWIILAAALLVMVQGGGTLHAWSLVGLLVWAVGLLIEAFADQQKFAFISEPANKGKWIDSGLWHYSRHPNYLGEILVWLGVYLAAVPNLMGWSLGVGLLSPAYITLLLLFVSGLPPLEKSADERWGRLPAYQAYKARTSVLLLLPVKKRS